MHIVHKLPVITFYSLRRALAFLVTIAFLSSCDPSNMRMGRAMKPPIIELDTICQEKMIQAAEYFSTKDTAINSKWHLQPGVHLWIDSSLTAQDFKDGSIEVLMAYPQLEDSQVYKKVNGRYLNEVRDFVHHVHKMRRALSVNRKGTVIWLANNSNDTFTYKSYSGFPLGLLEAKDRMGRWRAIQLYRTLNCGTGYEWGDLLPGRARAIVSLTDISGPFKTKIRYKMLGSDIMYSKELEASINYCQFWVDTHNPSYDSLDWTNFQPRREPGNTRLH